MKQCASEPQVPACVHAYAVSALCTALILLTAWYDPCMATSTKHQGAQKKVAPAMGTIKKVASPSGTIKKVAPAMGTIKKVSPRVHLISQQARQIGLHIGRHRPA